MRKIAVVYAFLRFAYAARKSAKRQNGAAKAGLAGYVQLL